MRAPTNLTRGSPGFNMTPMIDVVFLLIIFFLVSSQLAQQETLVELDLPEATGGETSQQDDKTRRLIVNVFSEAEGVVQVAGERLDHERLAEMVLFENRRAQGRLEVRIRTDRKVPYAVVEPIMVACAKAGVWKVTFAVVEGG